MFLAFEQHLQCTLGPRQREGVLRGTRAPRLMWVGARFRAGVSVCAEKGAAAEAALVVAACESTH